MEETKRLDSIKAAQKRHDAKRPAPISVRLTKQQLEKLDELRKDESRSGFFVRSAVLG